MVWYTKKQLKHREKILDTQTLVCSFLDMDKLNRLIHLFDEEKLPSEDTQLTNYIMKERKKRKLTDDIEIMHKVYNEHKTDSTLHLGILKGGKEIFHLSIHLCVSDLNSKRNGPIHIKKNIYVDKSENPEGKSVYSLIAIKKDPKKPNSLQFSIDDNIYIGAYDTIIKQETRVILSVLNQLFDETNHAMYLGSKQRTLAPIHPKTNTILKTINNRNKHTSRPNKGQLMNPPLVKNQPPLLLTPKQKPKVKTSHSTTRKKHTSKSSIPPPTNVKLMIN